MSEKVAELLFALMKMVNDEVEEEKEGAAAGTAALPAPEKVEAEAIRKKVKYVCMRVCVHMRVCACNRGRKRGRRGLPAPEQVDAEAIRKKVCCLYMYVHARACVHVRVCV